MDPCSKLRSVRWRIAKYAYYVDKGSASALVQHDITSVPTNPVASHKGRGTLTNYLSMNTDIRMEFDGQPNSRHTSHAASMPQTMDIDKVTEQPFWETYDDESQEIWLTLTGSIQLVVTRGSTIQESHSLWNAKNWIKAISKGDSMMFCIKIEGASRKFRVKFASQPLSTCRRPDNSMGTSGSCSADQCNDCATRLSQYFSVKRLAVTDGASNLEDMTNCEADGRDTSGKMSLVAAYSSAEFSSKQHLGSFLRLCLSDSQFPHFVGLIEAELEKVSAELTQRQDSQ